MADQRNAAPVGGAKSAATVSVLLCHAHVDMALDCLGSFKKMAVGAQPLRIHDDGTLTDEDCETLLEALAPASIVRRPEANARVMDEMKSCPRLLALRETYPHIAKAIDAVLWCEDEVYAFTDADVLYLRPLESPFALPAGGPRAIFMQDREPSYSMRSVGKLLTPGLGLPAKVNSGMIVCERAAIDFEMFEWFLGQKQLRAIPGVIEQALWAVLGKRIGCAVFDPAQVRVMREGEDEKDLAIGHFTAKTRHLLPRYVERPDRATAEPPVRIGLADAGECTARDLMGYEFRRAVRRLGVGA